MTQRDPADADPRPAARGDAAFLRRTLIVFGVGAAFVSVALLMWNATDVFLMAFAAVLLATFLDVPAGFLVRRAGAPRALAVPLVAVALLALLVGFGFLVGPRIAEQATQLVEQAPSSLQQLQDRIRDLPGGGWVMERVEEADGMGGGSGSGLVSRLTGTASTFWNVIGGLVFVVFLGLFLAVSPTTYRDGLATLVPPERRLRAVKVLNRIGKVLRGWLLGQLIAMAVVGTVTWAALSLLGVPLALVLGFIAALLEFVPIVGPIIAYLPALLMAMTQDFSTVLWVSAVYLLVQQLEGNVLVPLVQRRTVSLPPALTIAAVFVAGAAFGALGMLVATPLAAVGLVLYDMLYRHDLLGEHVELPAGGSE